MSVLKKLNFAAILTKHEARMKSPNLEMLRDLIAMISDLNLSLEGLLTQGLIPADNFDWEKIAFTSNASPDTEDTVAHTLKRIPEGFIVVNADKAARVYAGGTAWTSEAIYLKTDAASAALTIIVF